MRSTRWQSERSFAALCALSPVQASSGRRVRHRLSRGGNRQANSALWRIATNRMRTDAATKAYVTRHKADGKKRTEIIRCLKRHIAREIYRLITNPELRPATQPTSTTRYHRHRGRPNSRNLPQPNLSTRARPRPQPPTRHPIPEVAPNPRTGPVPDLINTDASNSTAKPPAARGARLRPSLRSTPPCNRSSHLGTVKPASIRPRPRRPSPAPPRIAATAQPKRGSVVATGRDYLPNAAPTRPDRPNKAKQNTEVQQK